MNEAVGQSFGHRPPSEKSASPELVKRYAEGTELTRGLVPLQHDI